MQLRHLGPWSAAVALTLSAAMIPVSAAPASATATGAPGGLRVARTGAGGNDLAVTWNAITGVDHYAVTVFDGKSDVVHVVPGGTTRAVYAGSGNCAHYRVTVAAVMPDATVASSAPFLVRSLAPGGITSPAASRTDSGVTGTVSWAPNSATGSAPTGYRVTLTQIATGTVVTTRSVTTTTVVFTALRADRTYVAKVTPVNAFGGCSAGTIVLGNQIPTAPGALHVNRAAGAPGTAELVWGAPAWAGYGPVTSYLIGYGHTSTPTSWVRSSSRTAALALDPTQTWVLRARTVNGSYVSSWGGSVTLLPLGAPGAPTVDPSAAVVATATGALVTFSAPIVSTTSFPLMTVAIAPTLGGTFRESHAVTNGAGSVEFTDVPCGVYTVTATGSGAGTVREFARTVIDRCNTGLLTPTDWRLVSGQATFAANKVSLPYGFVLSTRARAAQDAVVTTDATFTSGMGYGVLVRASANAAGGVSAFSVQYDHGWGDYFLLRQWDNGNECSGPLAYTKFPAGLNLTDSHHVVVVASGDSLDVTVDGLKVFTVPSLTKAVAASYCHYPMPTGTAIGFRSWGSAGDVTFVNTTLN